MKSLYEKILERFAASSSEFEGRELVPPKFIDLYDSQPEIPNQFEFMCPAIFIDYSIAWRKEGSWRLGRVTLDVHVLTSETPETDNLSRRLPEGLKKIDYYETVVDLLDGLESDETSSLVLIAERPVQTDYFNYHILTFECGISRQTEAKHPQVEATVEGVEIVGTNIKEFLL